MAVRIGHSSIGENGKTHSGAAGDQTGGEVCFREWYNKGWKILLRPKDAAVAERIAKACEDGCANENIGYDQWSRNTLNTQAKKVDYDLSKITAKCECDCSSFATVCAQAAGVAVPYNGSNAPTTRTMERSFICTGAFEGLRESRYLTSDTYLRRGDILLKPGSHTVIVLEDGSAADRYGVCTPTLLKLRTGDAGEDVRALQILLMGRGFEIKHGADGEFGEYTEAAVRAMQRKNGLSVDGLVGEPDWLALLGMG